MPPAVPDRSDVQIRLSVRMVDAACRYLWPSASCLEKSLTLWRILRSQGIETCVRIGARTASGHFEAHAWVELAATPLNEPHDAHRRYAAFPLRAPERP